MLQKAVDMAGNAGWVKKILRDSIYVDVCEVEKTLSHKDIILDGIDYTVRWRSQNEQGRRTRRTNDRIVFNAAPKIMTRRKAKKK